MRISNPPQTLPTSIAVTGITSPNTLTTHTPVSFSAGVSADFTPPSGTVEIELSNPSASQVAYVRDDAATTGSVGTMIQPQATVFLTLNDTIRLTTTTATTMTMAIQTIRKV